MNTFLVPSLRSQTSKKFVLYASYDPGLSKNVVSAMETALKLTEVHVLINPEQHTAMALNFSQLATRLKEYETKVDQVDIFITSRLDIDDTTHVGSVEAIQKFACSGREKVSGKQQLDRGDDSDSGEDQGEVNSLDKFVDPPSIRVAYIQGGQLWFPSNKSSRAYGEVGKNVFLFCIIFSIVPRSFVLENVIFNASCFLLLQVSGRRGKNVSMTIFTNSLPSCNL